MAQFRCSQKEENALTWRICSESFISRRKDELTPDNFERTLARFGFAPDYVEEHDEFDDPVWYTGTLPGKGAKEVWRFRV